MQFVQYLQEHVVKCHFLDGTNHIWGIHESHFTLALKSNTSPNYHSSQAPQAPNTYQAKSNTSPHILMQKPCYS